ncbi:MAG: DUF3180 domain-containing protein [Nocardioides sp.]
MSREPDLPPDPDDEEPPEPAGHIRPTSAGSLIGSALVGLVVGWSVRPLSESWRGTAPTVGWVPVLALVLVAAIVWGVGWSTYRTVQRRGLRLQAHHAVNRLVLAKSCALTGAVVGGGYLGYVLAWLGHTEAVLAQQRVLHSLVAAGASALVVAGSLLLERACRVRREDR